MNPILAGLAVDPPTTEQRAAIEMRERDVFCEAGAGTGKTRVLVGRYCDALCEGEAGIDEILAFTFTERAASELRSRIRRELLRRSRLEAVDGDQARAAELRRLARETERAWVTTIHGFCRRLLGTHPVAAGLDPRFRVLDAPESERLRAQAAREAVQALVAGGSDDVARVAASYQAWRLGEIALLAHSRLRNQGMRTPRLPEVDAPSLSTRKEKDMRPLTASEHADAVRAHGALDAVLAELNSRYTRLKGRRSGLDFSDLELEAVELLHSSEAVRALWQGRFRHLMVDEFQDTNRVQLDLVDALRGSETRLFTVGDEHQSIYRFRNADLAVFRARRHEARESEVTEVLPLRGNFRSKTPILDAANALGDSLLEGFEHLVPGDPGKQSSGAPAVELLLTLNEGRAADHRKWKDHADILRKPPSEGIDHTVAQARALAERLREIVDAKEASAGDIVVLLRAFTHVDAYEEALRRYGLEPYVVGGRGYWSQQQVEDVLRLLGCVANPLDDEMFLGALASPAVAVSPDALWLLRAAAGGGHLWPVVEHAFGDATGLEPAEPEWLEQVPEGDRGRLREFTGRLATLRGESALLPLDVLVERTMNAFAYDISLLAASQPTGRMANVRKLMRLAAEFERNEGRDLRTFLVQAAESTKRDEREGLAPVQAEDHDGVRIMTVHGAKGLEFPVVAVPELDRKLDVGHRSEDVWIGRPGADGEPGRFGLRLAFPTSKSIGVWELTELDQEEKEAEAEESCRLVYVAATRAQERLILSGVYKPGDLEAAEVQKPGDTALMRFLPVLTDAGWDGRAGRIDAPVLLSIRVSEPSEERARELTPEPAKPQLIPLTGIGEAPPLLGPERSVVPLGHLSYSALDAYKRCGYRFYLERVLGVRAGLAAAAPNSRDEQDEPAEGRAADELGDPELEPAERGPASPALALGNAVHAALEWSAGAGWEAPGEDRLRTLLAQEGLGDDAEALARARRLVDGWLGSTLCNELRDAQCRAEAPFVVPLGQTVLRGNIDLLAQSSGGTVVVDFKTDRVGSDGVEPLGERYASQRAVYALACAGVGDGPIRTAHVFLERPDEPVVQSFGEQDLVAARTSLESVIAQIRSGSFEPAADPYAALCLGCPAAARLCPRPAWRPPRTAPASVR